MSSPADTNPSRGNLIANGVYGCLVGGGSSSLVLLGEIVFGQKNPRDGRALLELVAGKPVPPHQFMKDWAEFQAHPSTTRQLMFWTFAVPFVAGTTFSFIRNMIYRCWIKEEIPFQVALANTIGSGMTLGVSGAVAPALLVTGFALSEISIIAGGAAMILAFPLAGALYAFLDGYLDVDRLAEKYSSKT